MLCLPEAGLCGGQWGGTTRAPKHQRAGRESEYCFRGWRWQRSLCLVALENEAGGGGALRASGIVPVVPCHRLSFWSQDILDRQDLNLLSQELSLPPFSPLQSPKTTWHLVKVASAPPSCHTPRSECYCLVSPLLLYKHRKIYNAL